MSEDPRDTRYHDVLRFLKEAEQAFARAAAARHDAERAQMVEEAEDWLIRAERRLARLTDRPISLTRPNVVASESRSFTEPRKPTEGLVWRRGHEV